MYWTEKLSDKPRFQECETRDFESGDGNVQRFYERQKERQKGAKGKVAGIYCGWVRGEFECEKSERKVSKKVRNRGKLPLREKSSRVDDQHQRGISVYFNRNEFFAHEHLAGVTRETDEKKTTWEKKLEMERISLETVCKFLEKSHRKLVWFSQQNRNAELKSTKIK